MNIKTILVTGASGKLGRSLIPALLGAGYSVRATQFKTPVRIPGVKTTKGSMSDPAFIRRALRGVDAVCHLATCKEDANNFMDVSVKGTFTLLDEARRHKRIKQLILASGDAALGIFFHSQPQPLDENAPLAAYPGYYAFSKVMEETMFAQYHIHPAHVLGTGRRRSLGLYFPPPAPFWRPSLAWPGDDPGAKKLLRTQAKRRRMPASPGRQALRAPHCLRCRRRRCLPAGARKPQRSRSNVQYRRACTILIRCPVKTHREPTRPARRKFHMPQLTRFRDRHHQSANRARISTST